MVEESVAGLLAVFRLSQSVAAPFSIKVPGLAVKAGFSLRRASKMPTGPRILHDGEDSGATVQLNAFSPRHLHVHGAT